MSEESTDRIRVLLVDDHPVVRYGVKHMLESEQDLDVVGELEGVGGISIEAFGQVAIDVEDGLDASVTEPGRDDRRVSALLDEQGDVAVAKVVESHGKTD